MVGTNLQYRYESKDVFRRHEVSISTQLLTLPDRSDYIVVFDHNQWVGIVHYHEQLTCSKQRAWFEEFISLDKVICMFLSGIFNGESMKKENTP